MLVVGWVVGCWSGVGWGLEQGGGDAARSFRVRSSSTTKCNPPPPISSATSSSSGSGRASTHLSVRGEEGVLAVDGQEVLGLDVAQHLLQLAPGRGEGRGRQLFPSAGLWGG